MSANGAAQSNLFSIPAGAQTEYRPILTATLNRKGVLDVDTVKGCACGLAAHPGGGCYGVCYAATTARTYGRDFSVSVPRRAPGRALHRVLRTVAAHKLSWYRIGTFGDPSHEWELTTGICELLLVTGKTPVIVTKHWRVLSEKQLDRLRVARAVINTSVSALDTRAELKHRLREFKRIGRAGIRSVLRVVTCKFGESPSARAASATQEALLSIQPLIDNPLRLSPKDERILRGDIIVTRRDDAIGGGRWVSLHANDVFLGHCVDCPDQCGTNEEGLYG